MTTQSLLPRATAVFAGLLCMVTVTFAEISIGTTPSVQYEWTEVNYTETCGATFTPANCVITGVKVYGNSVFLTVPRWKPGVPSTLNVIAADAPKRDPLLKPWPNCRWQEEGNPLALQYVQVCVVCELSYVLLIFDSHSEHGNRLEGANVDNRCWSEELCGRHSRQHRSSQDCSS